MRWGTNRVLALEDTIRTVTGCTAIRPVSPPRAPPGRKALYTLSRSLRHWGDTHRYRRPDLVSTQIRPVYSSLTVARR